jgi:hypothetical protein
MLDQGKIRVLKKAKHTLDLWNRVCTELDSGKEWKDINNDLFLEGKNMSLEHWEAYMSTRMRHNLNDIVLSFEYELDYENDKNT